MTQERLAFIKKLAVEAGKLTLGGHGKCAQIAKEGPDGYDIATEFDLRTEKLVRDRIAAAYDEPILGEEDGLIGDLEEAREKLWIVDPIDGTFNYQRGLPQYGVSIAFCEDGVPTCGAIYLPVMDQLFYAARGEGAFLLERGSMEALSPAQSTDTDPAQLVLSLDGKESFKLMAACEELAVPWRSVRLELCAVASMAYVAAGRFDTFVDHINLWDCAAADIILREAGAPGVLDAGGEEIFPKYVWRRFELGDTRKFPCIAVSSREFWDRVIRGLLVRAGMTG